MADTNTDSNATRYVYYASDPDGVTKNERCHRIYSDIPFEVLPYQVHKEAPDPSMKDPVWDDSLNHHLGGWKENDSSALSQDLAKVTEKVNQLQNLGDTVQDIKKTQVQASQDLADVKTAQQNAEKVQTVAQQQSLAVTKAVGQLMQSQEALTKMMKQMQEIMLSQAAKPQPTAPAQKTTASQPTQATKPAQATKPVQPTTAQPSQATEAKQENGGNK